MPPEVVPDVVFVVLPDVMFVMIPDGLVDRFDDGVALMVCGVSLGGGLVGRIRIGSVGRTKIGSVGRTRIGSVGLIFSTGVARPAVDSVG